MDSLVTFLCIFAVGYWVVYAIIRLSRHKPEPPLSTVIEPPLIEGPGHVLQRVPTIAEYMQASRGLGQAQSYPVAPRRAAIVAALRNQWLISITYEDDQGQVSSRDVMPFEIQHRGSRYMLFGHCSLRNEARHFRLDRIRELNVHASREATREKYRCAG